MGNLNMVNVFKYFGVFVLLYSNFCLASQIDQNEVSQVKHRQAGEATLICGKKYVKEIDDGVSDEEVIALQLASVCNSEFQRLRENFSSTLSDKPKTSHLIEQTKSDAFKVLVFLPIDIEYRQ